MCEIVNLSCSRNDSNRFTAFSVVEDTGFIRLVAELDSSYPTVVPEIQAKTKLKDTYISMTTANTWTSTNCHHSLTAHLVVSNTMGKKIWCYSKCLAVQRVTYRRNYLSSYFVMYTRNDVEEKIVRILRDNASNMVSGLTIANITSLPCLAHSLQPIIKDGVLLQQSDVQLLSCARSQVGHYHCSNVAFSTFKHNLIS